MTEHLGFMSPKLEHFPYYPLLYSLVLGSFFFLELFMPITLNSKYLISLRLTTLNYYPGPVFGGYLNKHSPPLLICSLIKYPFMY